MNGRKSREAHKAAKEAASIVGNQAAIGIIQALEYARGLELRIDKLEAYVFATPEEKADGV